MRGHVRPTRTRYWFAFRWENPWRGVCTFAAFTLGVHVWLDR